MSRSVSPSSARNQEGPRLVGSQHCRGGRATGGGALADLPPPDSSVLRCPKYWRTSVYSPHLGSSQQRGNCRRMSQVCFLISVKQFEALLCSHVRFACESEHIGACVPCFPLFSPPSDMPFETNVRNSLPPPPCLPGPLQEKQSNSAPSPSPGSVFI